MSDALKQIMTYLDACIVCATERSTSEKEEDYALYYQIIASTLVEFKSDAQKIIQGKGLSKPKTVLN